MKWIKRLVIFVVIVVVGLLGLQYAASEITGEVVVLTTTDDAGADHETRLWIVDSEGSAWLRAGMAESGWYARILRQPKVTLARNGQSAAFTALPTPEATSKVTNLIQQKYGWGETLLSSTLDRSTSVAIKLTPAN